MKFSEFINESKSLLVVDVQPAHSNFISFDIFNFTEYLNNFSGKIKYVFNGPDQGYEDEEELAEWLLENGLEYDTLNNIDFISKSYGWIRSAMDLIDEDEIIKVLQYMIKKRISDSREIDEDDYEKLELEDDTIDFLNSDSIGLPEIYNDMSHFSNSEIVGGGQNECLLEMEITLQAMKIKVKRNKSFIY